MEAQTDTAVVKITPGNDPEVVRFYNEAIKLRDYSEATLITEVAHLSPATEFLVLIAGVKKALEEKRKEYVQPLQTHVKAINDRFKSLMEPIEVADQVTRKKILAFQAEQERIRAEQERINALRVEAAQKEMELKGELIEPVDLVEVIEEVPTTVRGGMGTVSQRENWKWEVTDFALVPNDFKMINAGVLTPIVKASKGKITIPGIRVFSEPSIAVNTFKFRE